MSSETQNGNEGEGLSDELTELEGLTLALGLFETDIEELNDALSEGLKLFEELTDVLGDADTEILGDNDFDKDADKLGDKLAEFEGVGEILCDGL